MAPSEAKKRGKKKAKKTVFFGSESGGGLRDPERADLGFFLYFWQSGSFLSRIFGTAGLN